MAKPLPVIPKIALLDPSMDNQLNLGDQILSQDARWAILNAYPDARVYRFPATQRLTAKQYQSIRLCDRVFVCGGIMLNSHMDDQCHWALTLRDIFKLKPVTLLGVAWQCEKQGANLYTRSLLRGILGDDLQHAVRDEYTKYRLQQIGIKNVINTSCPSFWNHSAQTQLHIPKRKSKDVVFTLDWQRQDPATDGRILRLLSQQYRRLYYWPQGIRDHRYLDQISEEPIMLIDDNLKHLDQLFEEHDDIDYVGMRIEAGIRAIQKRKRAVLLDVDGSAHEFGQPIRLKVISRQDTTALRAWIGSSHRTRITPPQHAISAWLNQFEAYRNRLKNNDHEESDQGRSAA